GRADRRRLRTLRRRTGRGPGREPGAWRAARAGPVPEPGTGRHPRSRRRRAERARGSGRLGSLSRADRGARCDTTARAADRAGGHRRVRRSRRATRSPPRPSKAGTEPATIEVANEAGVPGVAEARLSRLARHVLDAMRVHPLAELSVVLVDEGPMTDLHVRWMDEPGPTDVLSFPMDELRPGGPGRISEPGVLGDVIICPQE